MSRIFHPSGTASAATTAESASGSISLAMTASVGTDTLPVSRRLRHCST
jgi:hypothetical protein